MLRFGDRYLAKLPEICAPPERYDAMVMVYAPAVDFAPAIAGASAVGARLWEKTQRFRARMTGLALRSCPGSIRLAVMVGDAAHAPRMADALLTRGVYVRQSGPSRLALPQRPLFNGRPDLTEHLDPAFIGVKTMGTLWRIRVCRSRHQNHAGAGLAALS